MVAANESPKIDHTEAVGPPSPGPVLAIYAHPDDPEVSCAGTLALWADRGADVYLVIATRGEKGTRDPTCDPDDLAATRSLEMTAAAEHLGLAGHEGLGYPDGELVNTVELRSRLVHLIRLYRPAIVVAPDPTAVFFGSSYVNHHDHREIGFAVLDSCAPASASPLYFPEAGPAHAVPEVYLSGTLAPDTWVDIASTLDRKVAALSCHRSQLGDDAGLAGDVVRRRAAAAGTEGGIRLAEAFRVLRLG